MVAVHRSAGAYVETNPNDRSQMGIRSARKRKSPTDGTTASSPSSPPRRRRRRRREDHLFSSSGEPRDWAALHHDVLLQIFSRLRQADILRGAGLVCEAWRRLAIDEPLMWRRIDLATADDEDYRSNVYEDEAPAAGWKLMARAAVQRSAGRCESFRGRVDRGFLLYLAYSAPLLRSLHVTNRLDMTSGDRFVRRVTRKLALLQQLVVSSGRIEKAALVAIADNCPSLELFDAGGCHHCQRLCRNQLERSFPSSIKVLRLPRRLIRSYQLGSSCRFRP